MRKLLVQAISVVMLCSLTFGVGKKSSRKSRGRALLVGINRYQQPWVPPTPGAEEDATETSKFIKEKYGFLDSEIQVLLGKEATAANIVQEFRRWLIEGTEPGDRVFFLYSGHGSRVPDDNGDEEDGYDEVLAPYDVNLPDDPKLQGTTFDHIIRDDLIGQLIAQLSGRHVVMVFDSCHSGTISRSAGNSQQEEKTYPRYLPSPEQLAKWRAAQGRTRGRQEAVDYEVRDNPQHMRDLKLIDQKEVGPSTGIVVISAAQAGQVAYPMSVSGGARGALSYVFNEAQRQRSPTLKQLRDEVTQRIKSFQREGKLKGSQVPSFEVFSTVPLEDQPLFANALLVPVIALANPQSTVKLSLRTRENKTVYHFGETVSYHFTTDRPGYFYLIVFSEKDIATCIFPNAEINNHWLEVGSHTITRDGREGFLVGEPAGKDVVVALLSATKLNLGGKREEYSWGEVFEILKNRRFSEYLKTRGQTSQKPSELTNWQAASIILEAVK